MKKPKNQQKINKGAPSGLIISLIFHAAAFFIAGLFVIFTVVNNPEPEFEAPRPIERPKMKLKKPKVKVKKNSQPKPSSRIVAKVKTKQMPEILLPDLMGTGEGLLGGGTGAGGVFIDLPDINVIRLMGTPVSTGNDFVGTYYDFNRKRNGGFYSISTQDYEYTVLEFFNSGWDTKLLNRYYQSPNKRYATCFMVPEIPSDLAPEAFGEQGAAGYCWGILYKGKLVHRDGIKFRFWGFGDDVLMVRVDGKLVLAASWPGSIIQNGCGWLSSGGQTGMYRLGAQGAQIGDWITLESGVPLDMEVFIGEVPGGEFSAQLLVEVEGVDYKLNNQGGPILPMFTTEKPSWKTIDAITEHLVLGEAMLTNGPVFNDFDSSSSGQINASEKGKDEVVATQVEENAQPKLRTWTLLSGKTIEAMYVKFVMDSVWLANGAGEVAKVPLASLVEEDQLYIELLNPPRLDIDFHAKENQLLGYYKGTPHLGDKIPPSVSECSFRTRVRVNDSKKYHHDLKVVYYAIGRQLLDRDKYILLEKKSDRFTPSERAEIEISGSKIKMRDYTFRQYNRGRAYAHYLVVVTDEWGGVVAHKESAKWLFKNLDKLEELPVGAFMDTTCTRVHPTGPKPTY